MKGLTPGAFRLPRIDFRHPHRLSGTALWNCRGVSAHCPNPPPTVRSRARVGSWFPSANRSAAIEPDTPYSARRRILVVWYWPARLYDHSAQNPFGVAATSRLLSYRIILTDVMDKMKTGGGRHLARRKAGHLCPAERTALCKQTTKIREPFSRIWGQSGRQDAVLHVWQGCQTLPRGGGHLARRKAGHLCPADRTALCKQTTKIREPSPREKVSIGRMRGKSPWQIQGHRVATVLESRQPIQSKRFTNKHAI